MCGITAYIGNRNCVPILLNGLKRLEYRGYDSCGIAIKKDKELEIIKTKGRISELNKIIKPELKSNIGIAHTRWATHGVPNTINAHPHTDCNNNLAIVHNGIIENYESLRKLLEKEGHTFKSNTDSEILAHFIEDFYTDDLLEAVRKALYQVVGSFGLVVLSKDKDELVVARRGSNIVLGIGDNEYFVASDVCAILDYTKDVIYLNDDEIVKITKDGYTITNLYRTKIDKKIEKIKWDIDKIEKKGYKHFMLKEIFEQPEVAKDILSGRIDYSKLSIHILGGTNIEDYLRNIKRIVIIACGTSWHCALVGKFILEKYLRINVEVDYASEFRYRDPIIDKDTLTIVISQSGETADTLAALREAKDKGSKIIGIVNVVGSTIARESHAGLYIRAGPEIGVASTKAFTNELIALFLLTLYIGRVTGKINAVDSDYLIKNLTKIPELLKSVLRLDSNIKDIAKTYYNKNNFLYLGRGINYPIALEGALKLKEISYIHAEGYPAAEMKHGPIALIDKDMPVLFIANKDKNYTKVISNMQEVKTRNGKIIAIATEGDEDIKKIADHVIYVPEVDTIFTPFINIIPLQLLSYYIADLKGCDIDKPRNLAKSVTVE